MCFCNLNTQFNLFWQNIIEDKHSTIPSVKVAGDSVATEDPEGEGLFVAVPSTMILHKKIHISILGPFW